MSPDNTLNGMLEPGEKVLWSHIVEAPDKADSRKENIIAKRFFRIVSLTAYAISAIFIFQGIMEINRVGEIADMAQEALRMGTIFALIGVANWFLSRTKWMQKLKRVTDRPVFQNGFVTDRRVVFFNHFNGIRAEYRPPNIAQATLDFENGGYALKIVPTNNDLHSVLVGGVDFKQAVEIISKHLL